MYPFRVRIDFNRLLYCKIKFLQVSEGILIHSSIVKASYSVKFFGCLANVIFFSILHNISMEFRSEFWNSYSITLTLSSTIHLLTISEVCLWSLSCWRYELFFLQFCGLNNVIEVLSALASDDECYVMTSLDTILVQCFFLAVTCVFLLTYSIIFCLNLVSLLCFLPLPIISIPLFEKLYNPHYESTCKFASFGTFSVWWRGSNDQLKWLITN